MNKCSGASRNEKPPRGYRNNLVNRERGRRKNTSALLLLSPSLPFPLLLSSSFLSEDKTNFPPSLRSLLSLPTFLSFFHFGFFSLLFSGVSLVSLGTATAAAVVLVGEGSELFGSEQVSILNSTKFATISTGNTNKQRQETKTTKKD